MGMMKDVSKNIKIFKKYSILTHNQGVVGSSPTGPTLIISHLQNIFCEWLFYMVNHTKTSPKI